MEIKYDLSKTKQMYSLFVNEKVTVFLNGETEQKITGILLHHTMYELLIKVKVKVKTSEGTKEAEKLRLIPKHSILYLKES
ncbi:hypothetical protein [Staphylococcus gallinarum]|uniref:hypothetical protein n=1 Tax=Staphylococcus gallinarum TaxID=1293 RepID=UPI001E41C53F|nr:hypothetical protein [Staphylococcus gallinarum]MCD8845195.1 hypothetical protein [Staphylococcus gallinarum]